MQANSANSPPLPQPSFSLGQVLITPGALAAVERDWALIISLLRRHATGDWGDLDEHDKQENRFALRANLRVFSSYRLSDSTTVWIITEAERSSTTILLPDEY